MKRHDIYRYLINFIYPNRCPCCDKIIGYNDDMCEVCRNTLTEYDGSFDIPHADGFIARYIYDETVKRIVLKFKRDPCGNTYYAFARGIADKLRETGAGGFDMIVCFPMHGDDLGERGYNQTELIAKELRHMLGVPFVNALTKIKKTKSQKSLGGAERRENVRDAFAVKDTALVKGRKILLIDDVCTTGSTLSETAKTLKNAGAEAVTAAAFAKTAGRTKEENGNEKEYEDIL